MGLVAFLVNRGTRKIQKQAQVLGSEGHPGKPPRYKDKRKAAPHAALRREG